MELALSLGDTQKPFSLLHNNPSSTLHNNKDPTSLCITLGGASFSGKSQDKRRGSSDPPLQLDLLPSTPVLRPQQPSSHLQIPWLTDAHGEERGSDDDENGSTRKKLRLSKDQSAFLEESFKEHTTLNPKQKLALAKQLNLRPRQVEVWFQNRRARTKLKQTEVDCEYLKRCCETLTEENRKLHKELQELRALKTSQPFYMQLPATTLTMCPSCEKVATNTTGGATTIHHISTTTTTNNDNGSQVYAELSLGKNNKILGFPYSQAHQQKAHNMAS
ncbi:PREDICTED: homeobox-leucine zipper protein HAT14-like isoform X4 [Lupinus angustifolius]|uniref:homeobox-leucine zipper protein HAT14-like isoform X4 n=1 Tax=Lupinus angustifolius TaxID=3871 RepID=UPI00092E6347|nr:PREDICTED: homeobox-leucine zipper protein HAT14-like isoform X4 [Lupinus angustifolius]